MKSWIYPIAELLGVKTFKKYWPVGGSFWNDHHTRKDSKTDIEKVLRDVKEYTRQHAQISFFVTMVYFLSWLAGVENVDLKYYFFVFIPMELYPFMVQAYNYYKAHDRLQELSKLEDSAIAIENEEGPISIRVIRDEDHHHFRSYPPAKERPSYRAPVTYRCEMYGTGARSPLFHSKEEAEEFRTLIYSVFSDDFVRLYNELTSDEMKKLSQNR